MTRSTLLLALLTLGLASSANAQSEHRADGFRPTEHTAPGLAAAIERHHTLVQMLPQGVCERPRSPCIQHLPEPPGAGVRGGFSQSTPDHWTDGIVYYEFHSSVTTTQQDIARNAMDALEAVCDVEFILATTQIFRIRFYDSTVGNDAFVGAPPICMTQAVYDSYNDPGLPVNVTNPCGGGLVTVPRTPIRIMNWDVFGTVLHEIMHALGFFHEQSRPDRDTFVRINADNIASGASNFNMASNAFTGLPYDFDSVMHYSACAFSDCQFCPACFLDPDGDGGRTIITNDSANQGRLGNREELSDGDILALRLFFGNTESVPPNLRHTNQYASQAVSLDCGDRVNGALDQARMGFFPNTTPFVNSTLWYDFVGTGQTAIVRTDSTSALTMRIFDPTQTNPISTAGSNQDAFINTVNGRLYQVSVTQTNTVDASGTIFGTNAAFNVDLRCGTSTNDSCTLPTPLQDVPDQPEVVDLTVATADGQSACAGNGNPSVWYRFTAPDNGELKLWTSGEIDDNSGGDPITIESVLSIHSACPGAIGNMLACSSTFDTGFGSGEPDIDANIRQVMNAGEEVLIRITHENGGFNNGMTEIEFEFRNDSMSCAGAVPLANGVLQSTDLKNSFATGSPGPSCGTNGQGFHNAYYSFQIPDKPGTLTVEGFGSTHVDTTVSVHAGCSGPQLACDTGAGSSAVATYQSQGNETVILALTSNTFVPEGQTGNASIRATFTPTPPPNDHCGTATDIPPSGGVFAGDTRGAANDYTAHCDAVFGALGVWYRLAGTGAEYTITTCELVDPAAGADFDTTVTVYSGLCDGLACVSANDDDGCAGQSNEFTSTVTLSTTPGEDYFILVQGLLGETGTFDLAVSTAPSTYTWTGAADGQTFFDEGNWIDSATGASPLPDAINPGSGIDGFVVVDTPGTPLIADGRVILDAGAEFTNTTLDILGGGGGFDGGTTGTSLLLRGGHFNAQFLNSIDVTLADGATVELRGGGAPLNDTNGTGNMRVNVDTHDVRLTFLDEDLAAFRAEHEGTVQIRSSPLALGADGEVGEPGDNAILEPAAGMLGTTVVPLVLAGDDCATSITIGEGTYVGTTAGHSASGHGDSCGQSETSPDAWFLFTPTLGGEYEITTCNPRTNYDTVLSATLFGCGTELACNGDDGTVNAACVVPEVNPDFNRASTIRLRLPAGEAVSIRVSGFLGDSGDFELTIAPVPPVVESVTRTQEQVQVNPDTVRYRVDFSQPVHGVDASNVSLDETGDLAGSFVSDTGPTAGVALDDPAGVIGSSDPNPALNLTSAFTVEAWVNLSIDAAPFVNTVFSNNAARTSGFRFGVRGSGQLDFTTYGRRNHVTVGTHVPIGRWTHIACVFDAGRDANFYVNGMFVETVAGSGGAISHAGARANLGNENGNGFVGMIDNIRLWSTERTQAEIFDNAYADLSGNEPGLVADWTLDGVDDLGVGAVGRNDLRDIGPNAIHADAGNPTLTEGRPLRGKFFDGAPASYARTDIDPAFDASVGLAIEAWINPCTIAKSLNILVTRPDSLANVGVGFRMNRGGGLRFSAWGIVHYDTLGDLITPDRWNHVAVVYDSVGSAHFYVDGAFVETVSVLPVTVGNNLRAYIGGDPVFASSGWIGSLQDVRYWNVERTAQQIADARFGIAGGEAGLVAAWPLDRFRSHGVGVPGVNDLSDITPGGHHADAAPVLEGVSETYYVDVIPGFGIGDLRLDVLDDGTILNAKSAPLEGAFTTGETYDITNVPFCPCEYDGDIAAVSILDLLAFLSDWFAFDPAADYNGDTVVDVLDLLSFLGCWFPAVTGEPCAT